MLGIFEIEVIAAIVAALFLLLFLLAWLAARPVARKAAERGRRVARVRHQWLRKYFVEGLTFLAFVYRVTTVSEDDGQSKATVRLYAYDPGQWFSRHRSHLRLFSGGVWRDA